MKRHLFRRTAIPQAPPLENPSGRQAAAPLPAGGLQAFFDRKARSWHKKYTAGGKLHSRLETFTRPMLALRPPPARVLDFGCGTGAISMALHRLGYQVTGCDIAESMLQAARREWKKAPVEWLKLPPDWSSLPFANGSFDAVIASSVFEYLADVTSVARELARILTPGGLLLFSVPNPYSRTRRWENILWAILLHPKWSSCFSAIRVVKSYATYLQLSRNRYGAGWWEAVLRSVELAPVEKSHFSDHRWREWSAHPLIVLSAVKSRQ